jgi:hypothetical protein
MKVRSSYFTLTLVSLIFLGMVLLGIPVSGFASEPHVCYPDQNGQIAEDPQHLGSGVTSFAFVYHANCGTHSTNTTLMKVTVRKDVAPFPKLTTCTGNTGQPNGNPVPPDYYTVTCTNLPSKVRVVIDYQAIGTGWMSWTEHFVIP